MSNKKPIEEQRKKMTVRLRPEQLKKISEISERMHVTKTSLVELGIDLVITRLG